MFIYIGLDDADIRTSRGTGRLARAIAADLEVVYRLHGIIRHQLLIDDRIRYTTFNSAICVILEAIGGTDLVALMQRVQRLMEADFLPGSNPGLCVTCKVPGEVSEFGRWVQREIVTQQAARDLAARHEIRLTGLGGNQEGVIGALAAVGLAATGEDGRYIAVGSINELSGLQPVAALLQAGIVRVCDENGQPVKDGRVQADKLWPARRGGKPVQFLSRQGEIWVPLKFN